MYDEDELFDLAAGDYEPSIRQHIIAVKKEFPESKKFKNVMVSTSTNFINVFCTTFKKYIIGKTEIIKNDKEDLRPISYNISNKNFYAVSKYYPNSKLFLLIILYKNKNKILDKFEKPEIYYPKGNYYLVHESYGYVLKKMTISEEYEPILNEDMYSKIKFDINAFFKKKDFFKKNKLLFKRGILLYGPPGNGKTSFIKNFLLNHKNTYNIIIDLSYSDFTKDMADFMKRNLGAYKKIIVFEDVDGINEYERSAFLNFLDGIDSMENMVSLATSNNINKIDPALLDRPSRFDKTYLIDLPNEKTRKLLLKRFFPKLKEKDLKEFVKSTEGFSGAYFKELFIVKNLHEISIRKAIKNLHEQITVRKTQGKKKDDHDEDDNYVG